MYENIIPPLPRDLTHRSAVAMYPADRTASQRWGSNDLRPGSAFHKIVVLPTFLPGAARPYEPPGTRPGVSAVNNIPRERPLARGAHSDNGMAIISCISLTYERSISATIQDNPAPNTMVSAPARMASTLPNPADPAINSNAQTIDVPPNTPGLLRTRFIEPIVAHSQPPQQTLLPVRRTPLPVPTPADAQLTQDSVNEHGM